MAAAKSLQALLSRSIDYAGLFPPAKLELEPALQNYAAYLRDPDAWMLSTFVLPVARFSGAAEKLSRFDAQYPLRISALGAKTESGAQFLDEIRTDAAAMAAFANKNGNRVSIEQLEVALPQSGDNSFFAELRSILADANARAFWEAPAAAAAETIAQLAQTKIGKFGFKLRTGGVTADAFPAAAEVANVLVAAAKQRVPIKFTAGLHHPVRMFRDEVKAKMHGFLNVLGAAVLAFEHGWDAGQTTVMLDDEDAGAFQFDDEEFRWRDWKIGTEAIKAHRRFVTSLGSCSFDEPREDLRALKLL